MKTLAVLVLALVAGCEERTASEKCVGGTVWIERPSGVWVQLDSTPFTKTFTPTPCLDK